MKNIYALLFVLLAVTANAQTKTWISDDGGVWHDETKWAPEGVPTVNDNVVIPSNATLDINENAVCNMITVNAGATMDINANLAFVESSIFAAGSVVDLVTGDIVFGGNGVLTVAGMLNVTSDLEKGMTGNGILDVTAPGSINFEEGGTGTFSLTGNVVLKISPTGVMNIDEDLTITAAGFLSNYSLTNEGTINKTGGTNTAIIAVPVINTNGEWNITSGTVDITSQITTQGAVLNIAESSEMIWSNLLKTLEGDHTGELEGPLTVNSNLRILDETSASFNFSGNGQVAWDGASQDFTGVLNNFSTINVTGGSSILGSTLVNHGVLNINTEENFVLSQGTVLDNQADGIINVNQSMAISGSFAAANLLNTGQINFQAGEGFISVAANVNNIESGVVNLGNDSVWFGSEYNGNGELRGDGTFNINSNNSALEGDLYPGETVGSITYSGNNLTTSAEAVYHLDINGTTPETEHDVFIIDGDNLSLFGTFDINLGYSPQLDDEFVVMTYVDTTVADLPSTVEAVYEGDTFTFDVDVTDTDVTLRVSNIVLRTEDLTAALPDLKVSPNPSNGRFQLAFGQYVEDLTITVRDITGRTVSSQTANGREVIFLEIQEAQGIYLVHIIADGKQAVRKVIKE
ncbi:T9SS type A sorting domain-containing protein [Cryomorphaceae bacterium 1068]|nr:T9SS type A sorting domain-containing protein [Cryomorphaceae bacterium 1068]